MVTLLHLFVFRPQSFQMTPLLESFAVPLVLTHSVLLAQSLFEFFDLRLEVVNEIATVCKMNSHLLVLIAQ